MAAPPSDVFEYLRNPANHAAISGDATVICDVKGSPLLEAESRFTMKMRRGPVRYRMTNTVVEYDLDRVIAWAHFGGHRWRYLLSLTDDGGTQVTETFDYSRYDALRSTVIRVTGFPERNRRGITATLVRLKDAAEADAVERSR